MGETAFWTASATSDGTSTTLSRLTRQAEQLALAGIWDDRAAEVNERIMALQPPCVGPAPDWRVAIWKTGGRTKRSVSIDGRLSSIPPAEWRQTSSKRLCGSVAIALRLQRSGLMNCFPAGCRREPRAIATWQLSSWSERCACVMASGLVLLWRARTETDTGCSRPRRCIGACCQTDQIRRLNWDWPPSCETRGDCRKPGS